MQKKHLHYNNVHYLTIHSYNIKLFTYAVLQANTIHLNITMRLFIQMCGIYAFSSFSPVGLIYTTSNFRLTAISIGGLSLFLCQHSALAGIALQLSSLLSPTRI